MSHPNPVLRGSRPDPSICRLGDEYVLVTSSAAFFPGLPIRTSRNLVHWRLAGHVLDRPSRLTGLGPRVEDGVWAPTIRCHEGVLYVVWTVSVDRTRHRMFVATATDPAGPWSEPAELDADGFDPSLFFDADGRAWLTACRDSTVPDEGPGELWMREFDIAGMALVGPTHSLWHGAMRGAWIEAPHVYRRDGRYLLLAAEGGTERGHAVVAATAPSVTGPYSADPRNPLLTHRHLGADAAFQNIGHADLVDDPDGRTWSVVLGARTDHGFHTTGRETFLVPVEWQDGVPVFAPGTGQVPGAVTTGVDGDVADEPLEWLSLRGPVDIEELPDGFAIPPAPLPLSAPGTPAFIATPQDEPVFRFTAVVAAPASGVAPALVAFHDERRFARVELARTPDGGVEARCVLQEGERERALGTVAVPEAAGLLWIESDGARYRFGVGGRPVAWFDARLLSAEEAGGFGGTVLGLAAVGPATEPPVEFRDVRYDRAPRTGPLLLRTISSGSST